jgi:hypothetical protein
MLDLSKGIYLCLCFSQWLKLRFVDLIILIGFHLLDRGLPLALAIRTFSRGFKSLDDGPFLRVLPDRWIASSWLLWKFGTLLMMLCSAVKDFQQNFIDFDITRCALNIRCQRDIATRLH